MVIAVSELLQQVLTCLGLGRTRLPSWIPPQTHQEQGRGHGGGGSVWWRLVPDPPKRRTSRSF